jgi:hypothetical protein
MMQNRGTTILALTRFFHPTHSKLLELGRQKFLLARGIISSRALKAGENISVHPKIHNGHSMAYGCKHPTERPTAMATPEADLVDMGTIPVPLWRPSGVAAE